MVRSHASKSHGAHLPTRLGENSRPQGFTDKLRLATMYGLWVVVQVQEVGHD